uniref:helicase-exonuclease AddAB subunit AddA n=1 Tax=Acetatifactor sp. TaxID=1872090 RepID=UPI0040567F03
MAVNFTPDQQKVIELHNCNILVSAAAGSGKTAVLVERIIRMVCDEEHPVDIDRLLIVTFTNAAAAEMRERIANGIAEQLLQYPESEHIQKQSTLLHNALITTIDSFSLFLIRNHFNEIGLDPAFRVADEGEIKLLQQDVLGEMIEDAYASENQDFRDCVEYFCPGGRESVLEKHILDLSRYAASFPWPEEWLLARKDDYNAETVEELCGSDYGKYLLTHVQRMVQGCVEKMDTACKICESPDGPYMYGELVEQESEQLERLAACRSLQEYAAKLPAINFGRLPSKKDDSVSAQKRELVKGIRSEVKETVQSIGEKFFATPLELAVEQGKECRMSVCTLIDLVLEFNRRMKEKKQEKKIIDFSDMEHYALDILLNRRGDGVYPSEVAMEYRQHFHEILIDEYQDSNLVQEYLLKAVSGEENGNFNRFMVGDVKQSIYKFRLARPELFLEKYEWYQKEEGDCRRIDLSKNFRSRTEVVDTVNDIFSRIMSREVGGIVYDEAAALYAGASYPENTGCEGELLLVEKLGKVLGAKEAEALAIAQKIKQLKAAYRVTDKGTGELRAAHYSDMVILLRTNSGWDEVFKKVLEEEGIPVYITSKTGYFGATEVQELLQLLRVLDNPRQDIPLFGVMKSIFGGFSEEEIALIRGTCKKGSLYEALCGYAAEAEPLHKRVDAFLQKINQYRDFTSYMSIRELLQRLVEDYDYLNYVTALPGGSKRKANVEMLFTKASDFEKTSYFGLFHFIRYIEQLEKYDVDYGEADILDENADVVRIMSIHKSKGLEFPITFVAGLSKRFNMQDVNQSLVIDMDMGLAADYVNPMKRIRNKTLRRTVLSRKMREDNLAEELRVLYVALTRAKEKLIMTASLEKAVEKWENCMQIQTDALSYIDFMEAGSYLDFLLPVLPQSKVKVEILQIDDLQGAQMMEQVQMYTGRQMLERAGELSNAEDLVKLKKQFTYSYPYRNLERLYTKTTVSELKIAAMADKDEAAYHSFEEKEVVPYIPAFKREEEGVSGTVRGNAYHRVMELLDLKELLGRQFAEVPPDYEAYREQLDVERLAEDLHQFLINEVKELRLSEEYFQVVRRQKIVNFLAASIAYRMWAAEVRGELYREQPFVYGVSAKRLSEEFPQEEKVLIQGIIDVFFVENGQLVLLDYKTDVVASLKELWNRYSTQLDYYEEALENLMGVPVGEKVLYSFYLEKTDD